MVSTSGSQLLPEQAVSTLIRQILPLTYLLTPNLPEAKLLLRTANVPFKEPENVDDIVTIAQAVQALGPKFVLLKGGHLPLTKGRLLAKDDTDQDVVVNVLHGDGKTTLMETAYLKSKNTHGTGCSLACKPSARHVESWLKKDSCDRLQSCLRYEHRRGCQKRQ